MTRTTNTRIAGFTFFFYIATAADDEALIKVRGASVNAGTSARNPY